MHARLTTRLKWLALGLSLAMAPGCGRAPLAAVTPTGVVAQARTALTEMLILPETLPEVARAVSTYDPAATVTEAQAMAALKAEPQRPVAFWQFQSRLMRSLAKRYPTAAEGQHFKWYGHDALTTDEVFRTGIPARPKVTPGDLLKIDLWHHQQDHAANDGLRGSCLTPLTPYRFAAGKGRIFKLAPLGGTVEMSRAIPYGRLVPWEVEYVMGAAQPAFVVAGALEVSTEPPMGFKHVPSFRKRLPARLRTSPLVDRLLADVRASMATGHKAAMVRRKLGGDYVMAPVPSGDYLPGLAGDDVVHGADILRTLESTAEEACVIRGAYTPNPRFRPGDVASL
jgi:hypothetical protein